MFLLCSSCSLKGSTRKKKKLLRSFLFPTETEKQKSGCHKSWWQVLASLAVCSTVRFQCCISLLETTGRFVLGQPAACSSEKMHLQGSCSKQGWLLPSKWEVAPVGGKTHGKCPGATFPMENVKQHAQSLLFPPCCCVHCAAGDGSFREQACLAGKHKEPSNQKGRLAGQWTCPKGHPGRATWFTKVCGEPGPN